MKAGRHEGVLWVLSTELTPRAFLNLFPFLALTELPQKWYEVELLPIIATNAVGILFSVLPGRRFARLGWTILVIDNVNLKVS
jgi:hypothetical protein